MQMTGAGMLRIGLRRSYRRNIAVAGESMANEKQRSDRSEQSQRF
jgi:hypothetical protein